MQQILIVEDDADLREALEDTLALEGWSYISAGNGQEALLLLKKQPVSLIVSDVSMPVMDGHQLLDSVREHWPGIPMVLMTAFGSINQAVEAMRRGAADYLVKPFEPDVLVKVLRPLLQSRPAAGVESDGPVVDDPASRELLQLAARVAKSDASVMIGGESGTGKEVLARYIHMQSQRADKPFVAINCAAIPESLLEATLFGYEKGAFTGANASTPGKFEQADGGTLLLDEVTEMPLELQSKLLRVLQEQEVERLGSRKTLKLDVRVLATSNRNLRQAVTDGVFREDLYYRLNVFPLAWPPLRERLGDILPLARALLVKHAQRMGVARAPEIHPDAAKMLKQHSWPGNVRELENVMQRALILAGGDPITPRSLVIEQVAVPVTGVPKPELSGGGGEDLREDLREQEYRMILDALRLEGGKKKETAERLGISPRTLRYKLARMREEGFLQEG
ncbi:sigma-54-dependent transcriptional regulator [Marinospirillum alkaliphilum]|uniref:Two-component system, response regulator FlrC n=1 Tax=Marinospirillum alkaliphilum DSM 21637 TaxID=1122209 RepID=A0A1K1VAA9_9GAMM|nr:sigma-54 dependent transcriptional regulator [Marinospirillum alkaliphilum]SFX22086.1 two-component system, response regulator FlrC [Marinospirillum alkaliphilum DSM 21637]